MSAPFCCRPRLRSGRDLSRRVQRPARRSPYEYVSTVAHKRHPRPDPAHAQTRAHTRTSRPERTHEHIHTRKGRCLREESTS
eukprot:1410693-Pleurochrysis_carterae.AAC.3